MLLFFIVVWYCIYFWFDIYIREMSIEGLIYIKVVIVKENKSLWDRN